MAIDALLWFFGVVERQCSLVGDAAGLPLIVVVKAAEPSEIVDRHIEMYLVTGGAELCGVLTVEGFEEALFMGFGIEADKVVMEFADCGIFAGSHFVQGRILDDISAVAHRIFDLLH